MTTEHRIRALVAALLVTSLTGWMSMASAKTPDPTLLQRLRKLLGIAQPLAAGGSRSPGTEICLISPWIFNSQKPALITERRPILHTKHPLNEVTIERNGVPVWQRLASSTEPIHTPITWPNALGPVEPGEHIVLILRSLHAPAGERVKITLEGASQERMNMHQARLNQLKQGNDQRTTIIKEALEQNNEELVIAVLEHSRNTPNSGELFQLAQRKTCSQSQG